MMKMVLEPKLNFSTETKKDSSIIVKQPKTLILLISFLEKLLNIILKKVI